MNRKLLLLAAVIIVAGAVVAGFLVVGSPSKNRAMANDRVRLDSIRSLQSQIINFASINHRLPKTLTEIADTAALPVDPVTKEAYTYERHTDNEFAICANFEAAYSTKDAERDYGSPMVTYPLKASTWDHGIGSACFSRTVDMTNPYQLNK